MTPRHPTNALELLATEPTAWATDDELAELDQLVDQLPNSRAFATLEDIVDPATATILATYPHEDLDDRDQLHKLARQGLMTRRRTEAAERLRRRGSRVW